MSEQGINVRRHNHFLETALNVSLTKIMNLLFNKAFVSFFSSPKITCVSYVPY